MAQLKDLLVLGASRFLNIIHGDIDGNAATADKVNKALTVTTPNGGSWTFDGSNAITANITLDTMGLGKSMTFVGEVVETSFGTDADDDKWCINTSGSNNVVPVSKWYDSTRNVGSNNFVPRIGDVVKCGTLELICVGLDETGVSVGGQTKTKNSHWAILGNNEVWGTY